MITLVFYYLQKYKQFEISLNHSEVKSMNSVVGINCWGGIESGGGDSLAGSDGSRWTSNYCVNRVLSYYAIGNNRWGGIGRPRGAEWADTAGAE
ncbi:hypothetical protein JTB14_027231 [Gonioctena quinquepunctata]|nr:hypothetical protein JTB14_027231 [Gonioctena quinquepunctata]